MLNLFSGAGLSNFSIVALGVYPYITASIIMQLMTPIIPRLNELSKEGQQGRNKINQYTHWLTVPLAFLQALRPRDCCSRAASAGRRADCSGLRPLRPRHLPPVARDSAVDDGRHDAAGLDGRADHRDTASATASRSSSSAASSPACPATVGSLLPAARRRSNIIGIVIFAADRADHHRRHRPDQRGPAPDPGSARQADSRQPACTAATPPTFRLRVNSAGMIPLIFAVSIMVFPGMIANFLAQLEPRVGARLRRLDLAILQSEQLPVQLHLLPDGGRVHVLLHDGGLPAAEDSREPAAAGRLHSGRRPGQATPRSICSGC